jgi:GNAT superfamily N-acetyltransferase
MTLRMDLIKEDEIDLLYGLILELAEFEKMSDAVVGTADDLRRSIFERGAAQALIARVGEEVVGYAVWFYNFSTFECKPGLYLEDIYVRPAHRRKGYGERILRYLAHLAVEQDCARMEWCVLDWNQPAIDFYAKMGAELKSAWRINRLSGAALKDCADMTGGNQLDQ